VRNLFLVGLMSAASMMAAPILTVIPTLGPNPSSSSFNGWTTNVINGLRGLQTPPVGAGAQQYSPLANGATLGDGQFIATEVLNFQSWQGVAPGPFAGQLGTTLYFSLIIRDSVAGVNSFSLDEVLADETYLGQMYGAFPVGGNYRGTAVGVQGDGTILNNNEAGTTLVNALYYVGVGFSWQATPGTGSNQDVLNQNIAAIRALKDRTTQVCYSIGDSASTCASVNVPGDDAAIPEPGTYALLGLGLAGVAMLRKRKA
jgi:hypothetical protein